MTDTAPDSSIVNLVADQLIHGDRRSQYGTYYDEAQRLAARWQDTLRKVTGIPDLRIPVDAVPLIMVDLKVVRLGSDPGHADSWVDIAGYAGCAGKIPWIREGVEEIGAGIGIRDERQIDEDLETCMRGAGVTVPPEEHPLQGMLDPFVYGCGCVVKGGALTNVCQRHWEAGHREGDLDTINDVPPEPDAPSASASAEHADVLRQQVDAWHRGASPSTIPIPPDQPDTEAALTQREATEIGLLARQLADKIQARKYRHVGATADGLIRAGETLKRAAEKLKVGLSSGGTVRTGATMPSDHYLPPSSYVEHPLAPNGFMRKDVADRLAGHDAGPSDDQIIDEEPEPYQVTHWGHACGCTGQGDMVESVCAVHHANGLRPGDTIRTLLMLKQNGWDGVMRDRHHASTAPSGSPS